MRVIAIANQKGGVGKTTTATCMASILNATGHKTLLIDTDVQCNSTDLYKAETEGVPTLYDMMVEEDSLSAEEVIQHMEAGDIIASDPLLVEAENLKEADAYFRLQEGLENLDGYEYAIIDTNPSVNVMLHNALVAADTVIIPVTADRMSVTGLSQLCRTIGKVQKHLNTKLTISGLLLIKYNDRYNLDRSVRKSFETITESLSTKLFGTYIRESTKCREAQGMRIPLIKYAPKSTTELDYEEFVLEFLRDEGRV